MVNKPIFSHLIIAIMVMGLFGHVLSATPESIRVGALQATSGQAGTLGSGPEILRLCAERAWAHKVKSVFWAFAPELFDGRLPELEDLAPAFSMP